jgi:ABC-2 type transport system permease protein
MSTAIFRVMMLGLLRDRGALAMSFAVPAVFFLIFASIFAATSGENFRPRVAVADERESEWSRTLIAMLQDSTNLDLMEDFFTADEVRTLVRRGTADAGLVIRAIDNSSGNDQSEQQVPFTVVSDPARGVATSVLTGQVQRAYARMSFGAVIARTPLVQEENVAGQAAGLNNIAYSAGAVAVLFLLLSAVHGAVTLFEERDSGILERVVTGPGSTVVLVNGKFLYLVTQGFAQVLVIFLVAWLVHGVDLPGHWWQWIVTTLAGAAAAAGLALAITTAFTTRQQAQTFANIAVLILSALGGSMVPRFLMPRVLQEIGWVTPNAWALEAYTSIFWRDESATALLLPVGLLVLAAVLGLAVAQRLTRRLVAL